MGWVVLQASFVGWVGLGPLATELGWITENGPRPCLDHRMISYVDKFAVLLQVM